MRSLTFKLTLAFLSVCLAVIGMAAAYIWSVNSFEFRNYVQDQRQNQFVAAVTSFYETNGSWDGIAAELQRQGLLPPPTQPGSGQQTPPQPFVLADRNGVVIVSGGQYPRGVQIPKGKLASGVSIKVNSQVVGTVLTTGQAPQPNAIEQQFYSRINQALLIAAAGGGLIALVLGLFLARTLTRPARDLTAATRLMAQGQLGLQVPVRSRDELGELTAAFNQMSADLARATQARKQMTADIAHDLRTPLTVIGGYIESMRDGVLKPTPDRLETIQAEVVHLQRLVEDLRTLSLADTGELKIQRSPVQPGDLLERMATAFRHQAEQKMIDLRVEIEPSLPEIDVDAARMEQVLGNLISNALRYTPEGGEITLSARREGKRLLLVIRDTGAGMEPEVLSHVFERFYRGDPARGGEESGLGLAIARSIVELHGAAISARSEGKDKGCEFEVAFPVGATDPLTGTM